jgi:hypothetical protein
MKARNTVAAALMTLAMASGCATTQVTEATAPVDRKLPRPDNIVVYDFAATPRDIAADRDLGVEYSGEMGTQSAEDARVGRELGAQMAAQLVEEIHAMGLPAARAAEQRPQVGDVVLKGYFKGIDEGSAAKRVMLGFGSGAAELTTVVKGYEQTASGLVEYGSAEFDSGGGKTPGMVVPIAVAVATANPVGLVVGGAVKATQEVTGSDKIQGAAKRTAEAIGEELRKRFERQGWIE